MKLTMLGTGHALVTKYYNTCFVLQDEEQCFLVDGGGGSGILSRLEKAGIDWRQIHDIFVTHKHVDHVMGIVWMIRLITDGMEKGRYAGEARVYAHRELLFTIEAMARMLLREQEVGFIGKRLHLIGVDDGETREIIGHEVTFFDIGSTKAKQYGFTIDIGDGEKLTCCGDEPYYDCEEPYVSGSKWLLHEAFCLHAEAEIYHPYEINHSTPKDACETAQALGVKNVILYHTEDDHFENRRELYTAEGARYFDGNIFVPEDLETIIL